MSRTKGPFPFVCSMTPLRVRLILLEVHSLLLMVLKLCDKDRNTDRDLSV